MCLRLRNEMKKRNAHHGPPIDAYIVPDTDEHQVINNLLKILYRCKVPIFIELYNFIQFR